ncbi:HAD family hydrolase [Tessaracoccus aquimaris]|uniref:HAD family hydrolase n=1 Tax=Tessaracoccus aquimaris TaxID=1332264 RepID=A0A1Q2CLS1_9ACTN|nr:HAD-IIA family hydrolase [Tessaracoccus aquimaris]AQP47057.1 HAD family hydrolase [Tessaracoccus aquimaris]
MTARFDAYLFDLDGTIYLGDRLLPGAAETIAWLRAEGVPFRFLSNNATRSPGQYAEKLTALGIPTVPADVVNTVTVTTHWLRTNHPEAVVFPIAERPLIEAFEAAGIAMSEDPAEIDIVVASYDRGFDYRKLQIAFDAIWFHKRAFLIATNPDRYCPFPGGRGEPDCAAVVAAIEASTSTTCRAVLGKPDPAMAAAALAGIDVDPTRCVMVGDRLGTDIELAHRSGLQSALVLTGDSSRADVEAAAPDARPGLVLERLDELIA